MVDQYRIVIMGPEPGNSLEENSNNVFLILPKSYDVIVKCFYFVQHIQFKIQATKDLINNLMSAEANAVNGLFYQSGLNIGYAISLMLA